MKALVFLLLCSCSLFNTNKLSNNPGKEIKSICLKGSGVGRIKAKGRKFPFTFDMGFEDELWLIGINFPLHSEDILEVNLKTGEYSEGIEQRILKSAKGVDPRSLTVFLKSWAKLIQETVLIQNGQKKAHAWKIEDNSLKRDLALGHFTGKLAFSSKSELGFFEKMTLDVVENSSTELELELIVRECLK